MTNNRLQFKRGTSAPGGILRAGEPAFDSNAGILYVGLSSDINGEENNFGQVIGGRSYVERVDSIIVDNENINVSGLTSTGDLFVTGIATIANLDLQGGGSLTGISTLSLVDLNASGSISFASSITGGDGYFDQLTVSGASTLTGAVTFGDSFGFVGDDVRITGVSSATDLGGGSASDALLPTQKAVREAINAVVLGEVGSITLDFEGDTGNGSVGLGSTSSTPLVIRGGDNIETVGSGTSVTIDLSDNVDIVGELTVGGGIDVTGGIQVGGGVTFNGNIEVAPGNSLTVEDLIVTGDTDLQGTVAIGQTLTVSSDTNLNGNVVIDGDLTVTGAATSISFEVRDVYIEDRVLELGTEGGASPSAPTGWELGLVMHYNTVSDGAKKAGLIWQDNNGFNLASDITEASATGNADPQITTNALADVGVGQLYIGSVSDSTKLVINQDKDASLSDVYIGGEIGVTTNKFVSLDNTLPGLAKIKIENTTFDGGTY